jgi:hypothetical protein
MVPLARENSALWFFICTLAAWRTTIFLVYENGPFGLGLHIRKAFVRIGLERLITCFHCAAFWVSLAFVAIVFERRMLSVVVVLAVSGSASFIERWLNDGSTELGREDDG